MIGKVNVKVGDSSYQFEVEEKSDIETLHKLIVLGNPPRICSVCDSDDIILDTNKDKEGNTYVNALCQKCKAKAKLGQYKAGGYFWRAFEQWQNATSQSIAPTSAPQGRSVQEQEIDIDEIPFD